MPLPALEALSSMPPATTSVGRRGNAVKQRVFRNDLWCFVGRLPYRSPKGHCINPRPVRGYDVAVVMAFVSLNFRVASVEASPKRGVTDYLTFPFMLWAIWRPRFPRGLKFAL